MDDPELEAIKQKRMQELQSQYGGRGQANPEMQAQEAERKQQVEEARQAMMSQILTADARERLARISLVKPDKARTVEDMLIRAAQSGQLGAKVDEPKLISLLEQIGEKKKETKITIQRRRYSDDED